MESFPEGIQFQKPWRRYQARVLSELDQCLEDNRVHIVAAPGSGKTILGLEVIRRLNKPSLILSPTLTIRDQWVDRFTALFLPPGAANPEWITTDIKKPQFMTVTTYQALHSAYAGEEERSAPEKEEEDASEPEEIDGLSPAAADVHDLVGRLLRPEEKEHENDATKTTEGDAQPTSKPGRRQIDIVGRLRRAGVKTIVVDECHHLRSEWWRSLTEVLQSLPEVRIVALTATPPYDVSPLEWERYEALCGPVDAEVSVPELVLEGNLCPHQDYIYASCPSPQETQHIDDFRSRVQRFFADTCANQEFVKALEEHPWLKDTEGNIEAILSDPAYFSSILIFLNHAGRELSGKLLRILGMPRKNLPQLDLEWMEILLTGFLYGHTEDSQPYAPVMEEMRRNLTRIGATERRKVTLRTTTAIRKILATSISKLDSISEIVRLESGSLGRDLRMVILTDFIRKADLPKGPQDLQPLNRIGVVPIFEKIRRECPKGIRLAALSGSLVIVEAASSEALKKAAAEMGIAPESISLTPLSHDPAYLRADIGGEHQQTIVSLMTRLFSEGTVTVLVGTKSLLGEGWDAPSINSLILATFVGSYMLSNQMRGRAIRSLPGNPEKTANVWHLVSVEKDTTEPGNDLDTLTRRFKAFVGVSFYGHYIENGIDRLAMGRPPFTDAWTTSVNGMMTTKAVDRKALRDDWEAALERGKEGMRIVEEVRAPVACLPRRLVFRDLIAALFWQGLFLGGYALGEALRGMEGVLRSASGKMCLTVVGVAFLVGAACALPKCLKALWLLIRHGPVASSMKQIGQALLRTLIHTGAIKTEPSKLALEVSKGKESTVSCSLRGATTYENSIYLAALREIVDPVENPRYLLVRLTMFGLIQRTDYHSVPQIIGNRKESAEFFARMWRRYVGTTKLVYARTVEGRRLLLRARSHSLAATSQPRSERLSSWK